MLVDKSAIGEWRCVHRLFTAAVRLGLLCAAGLALSVAHAEVTTQVTGNGLNSTVTTTANGVEITGGDRGAGGTGPNLFHSFGTFNVGSGDTATFFNDTALPTTNIIARVTDSRSDIFGTIQTTGFGTANLWLLNPNGFVFGPDATLNVGGSFHASTADYLSFSNGDMFVVDSAAPVLSVADPSAFGFLGTPTGGIDVLAGTVDDATDPVTIKTLLRVPEGKTLSLVGGDVNIGGQVDLDGDGTSDVSGTGYLLAPGGHVNLVSVASAGDVTFDPATINGSVAGPVTGDPSMRDIDVSGFAALGNINITQGSVIDAKEVFIRGGKLEIHRASVFPGSFWVNDFTVNGLSDPLPPPDGGLVDVSITGDAIITSTGLVPVIDDLAGITTFAGSPSDIVAGDVPGIRVEAGSLMMSGDVVIQSARFGPGAPPNIMITADRVDIERGAIAGISNYFAGAGGNLTINAQEVVLDGGNVPPSFNGFTGLAAQGQWHPGFGGLSIDPALYSADAGSITINASESVTMSDARMTASNSAFGTGGAITVMTNDLFLSDEAGILAQSTIGGSPGTIEINAGGTIDLTDRSRITASTFGSGSGGTVTITAGQSVRSDTLSNIFTSTAPPSQTQLDEFASHFGPIDYAYLQDLAREYLGIPDPTIFDVLFLLGPDGFGYLAIDDSMLIPGNGGTVSLITPMLTVSNQGGISSSTGWDGNAGNVIGQVGSLLIESGGEIRSRSGLVNLITGEIIAVGTGNAGNISFKATKDISISGGSISTSTVGAGIGGDIELDAGGNVEISNGGSVTSESTSTSSDAGDAGDITISSGNKINLDGGTISTRTVNSAGGFINLAAPKWVYLLDSEITTSVANGPETADGGDITIDPEFIILNHSNILANAFEGKGGNINLVADWIFRSTDSRVDASSALGIDGTINQSSPDQDVSKELAVLPENFLDVTGLISDRCGTSAGASSLVSAGPGGLAVDPDGYLPSFGTMNNAVYHGTGESSAIHSGQPLWAMNVDTSALQLARFTCTR